MNGLKIIYMSVSKIRISCDTFFARDKYSPWQSHILLPFLSFAISTMPTINWVLLSFLHDLLFWFSSCLMFNVGIVL